MPYPYYGYYRKIGELPPPGIDPEVYGLGEPANPLHEHVGIGFRPDFMPLYDPTGSPEHVSFANPWDFEAPAAATPWEQAETMIGVQERSRDRQRTHGRPLDRSPWESHADTGYDHEVTAHAGPYLLAGSPEVVAQVQAPPYEWGETWDVERRDEIVEPSERAWINGGNQVPGANSLPMNNVPTSRWNRDELSDDFGPALRQGVDIIVTVQRDMVQPFDGNLAHGMLHIPHPMLDNLAAVPQAPSQWPDRAMEPVDPYLPGGGMYSDWQRSVIPDSTTPDVEQIFADQVPEQPPAFDGSWE